jgi:hypothetical protein
MALSASVAVELPLFERDLTPVLEVSRLWYLDRGDWRGKERRWRNGC